MVSRGFPCRKLAARRMEEHCQMPPADVDWMEAPTANRQWYTHNAQRATGEGLVPSGGTQYDTPRYHHREGTREERRCTLK
jgi:hypothetical protein